MFLSIMNFYNMVIQTTSMQWVCMLKFPLCSVNNHIVKVFFLNKKGCKSLVQNVAKILIWISDMNLKKKNSSNGKWMKSENIKQSARNHRRRRMSNEILCHGRLWSRIPILFMKQLIHQLVGQVRQREGQLWHGEGQRTLRRPNCAGSWRYRIWQSIRHHLKKKSSMYVFKNSLILKFTQPYDT